MCGRSGVLFEMLTGKRAFDGEDVSETLASVLKGEPDWSSSPASLSPPLRELVAGCLVKDRRQRISDIGIARFVLRNTALFPAAALTTAQAEREARVLRRRARVAAAAAVLIVGIGGAAVWMAWPVREERHIAKFSVTLPDG